MSKRLRQATIRGRFKRESIVLHEEATNGYINIEIGFEAVNLTLHSARKLHEELGKMIMLQESKEYKKYLV